MAPVIQYDAVGVSKRLDRAQKIDAVLANVLLLFKRIPFELSRCRLYRSIHILPYLWPQQQVQSEKAGIRLGLFDRDGRLRIARKSTSVLLTAGREIESMWISYGTATAAGAEIAGTTGGSAFAEVVQTRLCVVVRLWRTRRRPYHTTSLTLERSFRAGQDNNQQPGARTTFGYGANIQQQHPAFLEQNGGWRGVNGKPES
jgi:hypothetical protein